jgi:pimeloyl-ACP methyl ester carboxylesterase
MQAVVDSLITNYQLSGSGKLVVLVHGWGDNSTTFKDLQQKLAARFQVLAVDLPGFGGTAAPHTTWGLNEYADFVKNLLDKIDVSKVHAFIGHSNGGAIVIKGLADDTLKAEKLVLLASAGVRSDQQARKYFLRYLAKTAKLLIKPLPKSKQLALRRLAYKAIGSDMFVAEHLQETFKKVVQTDVQAAAAKVKIPTLLVYGSNDTSTPVKYGQLLAQAMPKSKLEILPSAGHFVHQDEAVKVTNLIESFLS